MKNIYTILDRLGVEHKKYEHPAVFTVEQAEKYFGQIPCTHTKNLFLRNKKGTTYYLVTIPHNKRVDLKLLAESLDESRLSFASPERLKKYLGVEPGSVTLLGLINDKSHEVNVVIDKGLWRHDIIGCHPFTNTATLTLKKEDLQNFLGYTKNHVEFLDIP